MANWEAAGASIRAARKRAQWSQERLGEEANYSRTQVSNLEGGSRVSDESLYTIVSSFPEPIRADLETKLETLGFAAPGEASWESELDVISSIVPGLRSPRIDLSGDWDALWMTTVHGEQNMNRETVQVKRRVSGTWLFQNDSISVDNPTGGYLWAARIELFDNRHLLGYYVAREESVTAKGSLCMELQTNGREILGVWTGMNFDVMWASGFVAMCRPDPSRDKNVDDVLKTFLDKKPRMPYD